MKKASFLISISYLCRHNILILLTYDQETTSFGMMRLPRIKGTNTIDLELSKQMVDEYFLSRAVIVV